MRARNLLFLALAVLIPAMGSELRADEESPAARGLPQPPRIPAGPEAFQEDVERPDLVEFIGTLRQSLKLYETPPPRTDRITALHDAWSAILRPRVRRMTKRLEKWEDRKRWITPRGETKPIALHPDQWTQFTRDMASLITELHGAWKQYGTVKIKDKEPGLGMHSPPRIPRLYTYGYPRNVVVRGVRDRQLAGWGMGRYDMRSYWHLLNRFHGAWNWGLQNRSLYYEYWREQARIRKKTFESIRTDFENTRDDLMQHMLGVQALVAAMQNAEEERLLGTCTACESNDTLREMAEVALRDMETARLDAETYEGASSSQYGTLIRKWVRTRKAAVKVLEVIDDKFEAEHPEAPEGADPEAAKDYAEAPVPEPVPYPASQMRREADEHGEFDDLPEAKPAALGELLAAYPDASGAAKAAPGRFVGGPAGESYWPTKAEIRLAELCHRLEAALDKTPAAAAREVWTQAGLGAGALTYKTFTTVTVKVFGTGYVTLLEPRARAITAP